MSTLSAVVFVIAMLFLAAAIFSALAQLLKGGVKGLRAVPAVPLMVGYVIAFLLWLAL